MCKFAHAKKRDPTVEEALAAVHASRLDLAAGSRRSHRHGRCVQGRLRTFRVEQALRRLEGADLCRSGELCLAQLATVDGPVVLIDIVTSDRPPLTKVAQGAA